MFHPTDQWLAIKRRIHMKYFLDATRGSFSEVHKWGAVRLKELGAVRQLLVKVQGHLYTYSGAQISQIYKENENQGKNLGVREIGVKSQCSIKGSNFNEHDWLVVSSSRGLAKSVFQCIFLLKLELVLHLIDTKYTKYISVKTCTRKQLSVLWYSSVLSFLS